MKRKILNGWKIEIEYGYGNMAHKIYKRGDLIIKHNGKDGYDVIRDGKVIDSDPNLKDLMKYYEKEAN